MAKAGKKAVAGAQAASQNFGSVPPPAAAQKPAPKRGTSSKAAVKQVPAVVEVIAIEAVSTKPVPAPGPTAPAPAVAAPPAPAVATVEIDELTRHLRSALADAQSLRDQLGAAREEAVDVLNRLKAELTSASAAVAELRHVCKEAGERLAAEVGERSATANGLRHVRKQVEEVGHGTQAAQTGVRSLREECDKAGAALNTLAARNRTAFQEALGEALDGIRGLKAEAETGAALDAQNRTAVHEALAEALDGIRGLKADVEELRSRATESVASPVERPAPSDGAATPAAEPPRKNRLGVTVAPGVVISDVVPDSPASAAGLMRGDVMEEANGSVLQNGAELRDEVQGVAAGENVVLHLRRGGEQLVRTVRLGDDAADGGHGSRFGVTVAPGVVVADVFAGSPAEASGLAAGDVIEEANGQPVQSGDELLTVVHSQPEGAELPLVVTRAGERRELVVHLDRVSDGTGEKGGHQ